MKTQSIIYGDERIEFAVRFVPRSQRRVAIHVMPDGTVCVDAPENSELTDVIEAVKQRARWIWVQLEAQRERRLHVLPREYVSGETHFYLGRRHILKVQLDDQAPPRVRMWRGRLDVTTRSREPTIVRRLLEDWYRVHAQEIFVQVLADLAKHTAGLQFTPPWRLLTMRTQWGSCSPKGELLLNPHLVKAPRACIEYVIAHELCHLKEHNHSPRFYQHLSAILPDWQARKDELDRMAEQLLNR
ncbi:M48 family metallopeptidase [Chromobacterium violaceum]|uniref:M48 family metallopeptidase n=1 Tax=Chromobacterium violaceum TaxID=536 RepID=UPI001B334AF2|nr:M48 family metallopeptidase [Chromobacterium violaceum]